MCFSTATKVLTFAAIITSVAARSTTKYRRQAADVCMVDSVTNNPSQADAKAAIDQWNIDVNTVNAFLNQASGLTHGMEIQNATMQTLLFAQDEPCQLKTLISNSDFVGGGTDAFNCAAMDLMTVFDTHVLQNLRSIIMMPTDGDVINHAINDINTFRCCNVLPDAKILWLDSATDNGIANEVNTTPGLEDACASINCATVSTAANCTSLNNGNNPLR
ncbi:hypothetical protein E4T44_07651 [Aureobasidium sp. EXF-8845]|nr:hypothetical protein E4T44_07651 [Aureobasidium sp. EXF-8845]KAI4845670.1 hypothetical protein E4T45_07601 [Aureobasidium sp. EXF-8846]